MEKYSQEHLRNIRSLVEGEKNIIANLSNVSAYLNEILEDINWVGFYFHEHDELVLGPFQGKVACVRIPDGKGVCGHAVVTQKVIRVDDVHHFPGHIACDSASKSEIVLPMIYQNRVFGVLDIDSPIISRFQQQDQSFLEEVVKILEEDVLNKDQK